MEVILVSACVLYFCVLIIWAFRQARKRQQAITTAWNDYSDALLELAKNPKSDELLKKVKELGETYYQFKIPDSYGPEIFAPVNPLSDSIPPWDRNNVTFINNSEARENALKKDIDLKCPSVFDEKKVA